MHSFFVVDGAVMAIHSHVAILDMVHRLVAMSMLVSIALGRVTKRVVVDGLVLLDVVHLTVVMSLHMMLLFVLSSMQLVALGTLQRLVTDAMSELRAKLIDGLLLLQENLRVAQVQDMTVLGRVAVVHMLMVVVMVMVVSDWR